MDDGHHFAGFGSEGGEAENAIVGADQGFRIPACVREGARAQHGCHRLLGESIGDVFRFGFALAQPDVGQFGVGEQAVGNDAIARRAMSAVDVAQEDAEVVLAGVGEGRAAGTLARGPHVGRGGLQSLVDANVAARVELDPGLFQPNAIGVGSAAGGHEDVGAGDRFLRAAGADANVDGLARTAADFEHLGLQEDIDPFIAQQLFDRRGNIGVFAVEQLLAALNDRDAAAEAAHGLRELQADVAAANDNQVLGQASRLSASTCVSGLAAANLGTLGIAAHEPRPRKTRSP